MIDTSVWKPFKVSDIFITKKHGSELQTPTGAAMSKKDLEDGDTPRVTVSNFNNGITGYYADSDNKNYRTYENFISVSFLGTVFYQPKKVSLDMKVHCLKPLDYELNVYSACYIVSIIRKAISNFAYSDQLSSTVLAELEFALPTTSDGQPDWDYMESYMKAVIEESEKSLENLKKANDTKQLIDVSGWGEFRVGDLFDVSRPSSRSSQNYDEGDMPFVASGNFNNGVTAYLQPKDDNDYDDGGCITVSAVDGYAFYQKDKFLGRGGAGSSIMMLRNDNLNELNGKYICTLIRKACNDWEYSNMGNKDKLADTMIWLPITSSGEPDWNYMESYMKSIMKETENNLAILKTL